MAVSMHGRGVHGKEGMCGGGDAWQGAYEAGEMCGRGAYVAEGGMHGRWYASYWSAFLWFLK